MDEKTKAGEAAAYIQKHLDEKPEIGFLIGTGLGDTAGMIKHQTVLDYAEIPHFPVSTVQSHRGKLVLGMAFGKPVMALQGRFHLYEGYSPRQVSFPVRVMQELGTGVLVLSNAAGGINPEFNAGDIMVIRDHINLTGENPLVGPNDDAWGERFPDMIGAYDKTLAELAMEGGRLHGTPMRRGVYVGLKGPSLETPAEVKFLKTIGAEAVGFSTVQETIAAVHGGIKVLGLSIITNVLRPENPVPARVEDIIETAGRTAPAVEKIIAYVLKHLKV
jgi:purine-nucleoside phosphorylase